MTCLLNALDVEFDLETECVVVGAGACGLVAALVLADAGVDVLVLEGDVKPSGSTSMSSGFIPAAGTAVQRALGIEDSAEQFAADIQRKANDEADATIVRAVTQTTGSVLDWLAERHALEWLLLDDFLYPGHSTWRMHAVPGKTGAALLEYLLRAATRAQVALATSARVDALVVSYEGQTDHSVKPTGVQQSGVPVVQGVRVRRPDGTLELIKASSVILACNGYGANPQLMQRFVPEMARAHYHGHAGNTGDAIQWGELLGAPLKHTGAYQGHGSLAHGHNILITWALMMAGGVQLNKFGKRFSNEHGGYSEQAVHVINQPGETAWNLYDQRLHELGLGFPDYCEAHDAGAVISANTLNELAVATGMPETQLTATVQELQALAASGAADRFGRRFKHAHALRAPYYAIKVAPAIFHTQGGLAIDADAGVLHDNGEVIDNLYAAGGAACGVSGSTVAGYLSGNGLLTAVALGAIAASSVCRKLGRKSSLQHINGRQADT